MSGLAACRRERASPYLGYAFIANRQGNSVAVVDLGAFAVARHIRLEGSPELVISHPELPAVYVVEPDTSRIGEINTDTLTLRREVDCGARPSRALLSTDGQSLWVLCQEPAQLVQVELSEFSIAARIDLPLPVCEFDLSPDGLRSAVSFGDTGKVGVVDLESGKVAAIADAGVSAGQLVYRSDGGAILVGDASSSTLNILEPAGGSLVVRLPLAVGPEHFSVSADGGQLYITGQGMDAVVVVYPYQTQVAATILAGRAPGYLAPSGDSLFVANPATGDVTVLDIRTSQVIAVVAVGREPAYITFTPDSAYALVLNRESGDMAVIRVAALSGRRRRLAPLFTMIPVGSEPVSAAVRSI